MERFQSPTAYYHSRGLEPPDRRCNSRVVGLVDYWSAGPMCRWTDSRSRDVLHIAFMPRSLHAVRSLDDLAGDVSGELVATEIVRGFVRGVRVMSELASLGDFDLLLRGHRTESDYRWVLDRVCCIGSDRLRLTGC